MIRRAESFMPAMSTTSRALREMAQRSYSAQDYARRDVPVAARARARALLMFMLPRVYAAMALPRDIHAFHYFATFRLFDACYNVDTFHSSFRCHFDIYAIPLLVYVMRLRYAARRRSYAILSLCARCYVCCLCRALLRAVTYAAR